MEDVIDSLSPSGVFSTTGDRRYGDIVFPPEQNVREIAGNFDLCGVAFYLSIQGSGTLMGAAVEVREIKENDHEGRQDRVIYLEQIRKKQFTFQDICDFYDRMYANLCSHNYNVLGLPVAPHFFQEKPEMRSWNTDEAVKYTWERLNHRNSVVCTSDAIMESLYYLGKVLEGKTLRHPLTLVISRLSVANTDVSVLFTSLSSGDYIEIRSGTAVVHRKRDLPPPLPPRPVPGHEPEPESRMRIFLLLLVVAAIVVTVTVALVFMTNMTPPVVNDPNVSTDAFEIVMSGNAGRVDIPPAANDGGYAAVPTDESIPQFPEESGRTTVPSKNSNANISGIQSELLNLPSDIMQKLTS